MTRHDIRSARGQPWDNPPRKEPRMVNFTVNGKSRSFDGDPDMPLLWYLRDDLRLTGTRFGCGAGLCGACTVHVDGQAVRSCQTRMQTLQNKTVLTIEGLSANGTHPVQRAWAAINVPQCGYCQSGQIMQAAALLARNTAPTDQDIDRAMAGNICRCGTYQRIRAAIKSAAKERA
jgi:isoquinoline 1-oxidoreductase alpha subunit